MGECLKDPACTSTGGHSKKCCAVTFPYKQSDGIQLRPGVTAHRQPDGSIVVAWWANGVVRDCVTFRAGEAEAIGRLAGQAETGKAA